MGVGDLLGEPCESSGTRVVGAKLAQPLPGREVTPGSLTPGRLVLAEFSGGWYYANILKAGPVKCDVAWLRPNGLQWGSSAMGRYLCSTGADETDHGENLPIASRVRLPDESGPGQKARAPPPTGNAPPAAQDLLA